MISQGHVAKQNQKESENQYKINEKNKKKKKNIEVGDFEVHRGK